MVKIDDKEYQCVDPISVARYDFWRWMIPILLAALLLFLWLFMRLLGFAPTLLGVQEAVAGSTVLNGTGRPGSTVQVTEGSEPGGDVIGSAVVDSNGAWAMPLPDLDAGEYQVSAADVDASGNLKRSGFDADLGVGDLSVYDVPTLALPDGDLTAGPLSLTGTGTPGTDLAILQDGVEIGTATVGSDGTWSFETDDLDVGEYDFSARLDDSQGNALVTLAGLTAAIAPILVADPPPSIAPTLEGLNAAIDDAGVGGLSLSGTGEPGGQVEVNIGGDTTIVDVDEDGNWTLDLDGFDPGSDVDVIVSSLDGDGNPIEDSAVSGSVTLPEVEVEIAMPTLDGIEFNEDDPSLGALSLTGTGEPGGQVEVVVNGEAIVVDVDSDGNWSLDLEGLEPGGEFDVSVTALDGDGNAVDGSNVVRSITLPDVEVIDLEIPTVSLPNFDGLDPSTGRLSLEGTGSPDSDVEIVLDDELQGRTPVDPDGRWSYDLDELVPGRLYNLIIRAINRNGEIASQTDPISIAYPELIVESGSDEDGDASTDATPTPETVVDNSDDGSLPRIIDTNTDLVGNPIPGFFGLGNPNTILEIVDRNGNIIGVASVNSNGDWRCNCVLPPGSYELGVRERENPSATSNFIILDIANPAPALNFPEATPDPNNPFDCSGTPTPGVINLDAKTYTVGRCESVFVIANRLQTTIADLVLFNPQLADPSRIYSGQILNIPTDAGCFDAP